MKELASVYLKKRRLRVSVTPDLKSQKSIPVDRRTGLLCMLLKASLRLLPGVSLDGLPSVRVSDALVLLFFPLDGPPWRRTVSSESGWASSGPGTAPHLL